METKPTTPSVIARLMGIDSLPNQQPVKKQKLQRVLSENYRRKVASIGVWGKRSFDQRRSFRFNIEEQTEFKDVYEVRDSFEGDKESDLFAEKGSLDLRLLLGKAPFSCGSLDAQYVTVGIKCKPAKEVHSEHSWPGFVDSRNHFQKAGYVTTKHYDQNGVSSHLQSEHVRILESSNAFGCEKIEMSRKHAPDGTYIFPRFHLEANNERRPSFRKIVVLKPKPRKSENAIKCFSSISTSEGSDSGNRKDKRFHGHGKGNSPAQVKESMNLSNVVKFTGHRSIISCETEKEITRKTMQSMNNIPLEPPRSRFSGVHCLAKEPQFMMVSSPTYSNGSYVTQEAEKRISERCRMAKEIQENVLATEGRCKSTTLGEMLALPDYEKHANSHTALGISREDGWNNRGVGDLTKSRSPSYSTSVGSPKTRTSHNAFYDDSFRTTRPLFSLNWSRMKSSKQSSSGKDGLEQRDSGSNCIKSPSSPRLEPEKNHVLEGKYVIHDTLKNNLEKQDASEQHSKVSKSLEHYIVGNDSESKITPTDKWNDIKHGNMSAEGSSKKEDISMEISEDSGTDPDSLVNSETYQPSPVSVLESPFEEHALFSSKCFHNVSVSLHDVRRQLEFLKSESFERDSEGSGMVVSSDDEAGDESPEDCKVNEDSTTLFGVKDSSEFSYMVDVLTEAGFHSKNQDKGLDGWYSPECPISPSVFESLEKKYAEQISWKMSARRLLFDRINSGLMEYLQPCLGEPMWAKPLARRFSFSQNLKVIEKQLYTFLVNQEKEAGKRSSEKVLAKDDGWLFLGYEIEVIGREIENSLVDELAAEIVRIESF